MMTLVGLIDTAKQHSLTYNILAPSSSPTKIPPFDTTPDLPDVLFLLNFTTAQRSALLTAPTTLVFMYTPANEHFGIGPVEAMLSGLPVLACDSGGPTESVVNGPADERTGWLRPPSPNMWADALEEIMALSVQERDALRVRAQTRAKELFSMVAMAKGIESALEEAVRLGPVSALNTRMFLVASVACLFAIFAFYYL
jgi:alpha-1,3/alpha-1,6-mannosyltransferase